MMYVLLGLAALVALINAYRVASFEPGRDLAATAHPYFPYALIDNSRLELWRYLSGE